MKVELEDRIEYLKSEIENPYNRDYYKTELRLKLARLEELYDDMYGY